MIITAWTCSCILLTVILLIIVELLLTGNSVKSKIFLDTKNRIVNNYQNVIIILT